MEKIKFTKMRQRLFIYAWRGSNFGSSEDTKEVARRLVELLKS